MRDTCPRCDGRFLRQVGLQHLEGSVVPKWLCTDCRCEFDGREKTIGEPRKVREVWEALER